MTLPKGSLDSSLSRRGFLFSLALAPAIVRANGGHNVTAANAINRVLTWRRVTDDASIEFATVESLPDGFALCGTVLASEAGKPVHVDYRLIVDLNWRTRLLDVRQEFDGERQSLTLTADGFGRGG